MSKLYFFPTQRITTQIVKWARLFSVADVGLTTMQRRELDRAVAAGYLVKGTGGPFPLPVDVYAHPGFDFAAERQAELAAIQYLKTVTRRAA